ncbi:phosphoribosyl-ATP diphosphatase [Aquisalinus flavus]|uniref:Phosphoribosyl-ATP pyrophosphatase n=1 Tax=Aquisalinus flavus TaxID=1526572 RepID=A0A8J2V757_9PROT|nr:phosphoribosyl-ATP diphosphatase [Aquisalinus flavus]GGD14577.1 phosphoribosyl-ATP pyrophosphatase [Aquisalinus flavus]
MDRNLGQQLDALWQTIESRRGADPDSSYTASLLAQGAERCAKKFGEEAVEAAIAGALGNKDELAAEAADTLYHLFVLMAAAGVEPADIAAKLAGRTSQSGHEEKASRKG